MATYLSSAIARLKCAFTLITLLQSAWGLTKDRAIVLQPPQGAAQCACFLAHASSSNATTSTAPLHHPLHVVDAAILPPGMHMLALQCRRCVLSPPRLSVQVAATGDLHLSDGSANNNVQHVDDGNTTLLVVKLAARSSGSTVWRVLLPVVCLASTMLAVLCAQWY